MSAAAGRPAGRSRVAQRVVTGPSGAIYNLLLLWRRVGCIEGCASSLFKHALDDGGHHERNSVRNECSAKPSRPSHESSFDARPHPAALPPYEIDRPLVWDRRVGDG